MVTEYKRRSTLRSTTLHYIIAHITSFIPLSAQPIFPDKRLEVVLLTWNEEHLQHFYGAHRTAHSLLEAGLLCHGRSRTVGLKTIPRRIPAADGSLHWPHCCQRTHRRMQLIWSFVWPWILPWCFALETATLRRVMTRTRWWWWRRLLRLREEENEQKEEEKEEEKYERKKKKKKIW